MKKLLLLPVFIFVVSFSAFGQVHLGPKVGFNITNFGLTKEGKDNFNMNSVTGFSAGVGLEIPFGGRFLGVIEGIYAQKGGRFNSKGVYTLENGNQYFLELEDRINYLDVPVLIKYHFRGKDFGFNLQGGISLGFALNAERSKGKYTNQADPADILVLEKKSYNLGDGVLDEYLKSDFGILLGAGFFYELEVGKLIVDARYYLGSSNIYNTPFDTQEITNRGLMFSVGYMFPLGGGW